jgi:hypothetical protein
MSPSFPWKSGGESFDDPTAGVLASEAKPVVQPARAALPELDSLGDESEAAPVVRPWDRRVVGMLRAEAGKELFEGVAVRDDLALR